MATKTSSHQTKSRYKRQQASRWRTRKQWEKWEKVGMRPSMDLDDLDLRWIGKKAKDLPIKGMVQSIRVERTIEGASTITVTIKDPHGHIMSQEAGRVVKRSKQPPPVDEDWEPINAPNMVGRACELWLDGVPFRLTKVDGDLLDNYVLVFEERPVYWMRRHPGKNHPRAASRTDATRAEFILSMVREIKIEQIPFVCPSLHVKQAQVPVEDDTPSLAAMGMRAMRIMGGATNPSQTSSDQREQERLSSLYGWGQSYGYEATDEVTDLTVKGQPATHEQKRVLNEVIQAAFGVKGASEKTVQSAVCTVITETAGGNPEGGTSTSVGAFQLLASTAQTFGIDPMNISDCTEGYMTHGYARAGAIQFAKDHPDAKVYEICQAVQGSGAGRATNGRANYGPWVEEAKHWVEVYSGKSTAQGGGTYRKPFQFQRDKDEDSWECGLRLADDVQWRLFVVGRVIYFVSETELFRQPIRYVLKKDDPAILEFPWSIDWNKPVNECSIKVNLERWGAPPGANILVQGFGMPDGRWLVKSIERDWFDWSADVTLTAPLPPLKEPAPETGELEQGISGEGTGGDIGKLYKACKHISDVGGPYVWGGGHTGPLSSTSSNGLDCSGSCSLALFRAGLWDAKQTTAFVSGDFDKWGASGEGHLFTVKYSNEHVWIKFEEAAGMMYKRFDTSPHGCQDRGPRMRTCERPDDGFQNRHWPGM